MGLPSQYQLSYFRIQALRAPLREHGDAHMAFGDALHALHSILYVHGYDVRCGAECGGQGVQHVAFCLLGHFDVIYQPKIVNIDGQFRIKHSPQSFHNFLNVQQSSSFMIHNIGQGLADIFGNIIHARV